MGENVCVHKGVMFPSELIGAGVDTVTAAESFDPGVVPAVAFHTDDKSQMLAGVLSSVKGVHVS